MQLNLLVLRAESPLPLVRFYEALGLRFRTERHAGGPEHYSCLCGGVTLEIYPTSEGQASEATRIGFTVEDVEGVCHAGEGPGRVLSGPSETAWGIQAVIIDPAGNKVELLQRP